MYYEPLMSKMILTQIKQKYFQNYTHFSIIVAPFYCHGSKYDETMSR